MWQPNSENSIKWASELYPVGVVGGIPGDWTQFCDVSLEPYGADPTGSKDCTDAINRALADCPERGVVFLPEGRYLVEGTISFGDPMYGVVQNKILRGAGIGKTVIADRSSNVAVISLGSDLSWTTPSHVPLVGPITKGENRLELSGPVPFALGQIVYLDEEDDRQEFGSPVSGMPNNQTKRLHRQTVQITALDGPKVTISPASAWDFTRSPALNDFGFLGESGNYALRGCGVENLSLDRSSSRAQISVMLIQCVGCWLSQVESVKAPSYHFHAQDSLFCTFSGCVAQDVQGDIGPNQGGLLLYRRACSCLIEDCLFDRTFPGIEISSGSCANVIGYCYVRRNTGTSGSMQGAAIDTCHGSHTGLNLVEGCVTANVEADGYYGSASRDTIFRSNAHGQNEEGVTDGSKCISLCRWSTKMTVADCVLGSDGVPAIYEASANNYPYSQAVIWRLGYPNMGNNSWEGEIPPLVAAQAPQARDRRVEQTLTRIGNYDSVTKAIDQADTFPASLYLGAKPAWFGNLAWPPIGAELEPPLGMIPAQARYQGIAFPYSEAPPDPVPPEPEPEPDQPWATTPDGQTANWQELNLKGIRWIWGA